MHHDKHIVFGIGVNDAYRLESTVARVPRIVLGRRAIEAADRFATVFEPHKSSWLLRDTEDGVWYLNYLRRLKIFNRENPNRPEVHQNQLYAVGYAL